jgi:hypothetical protein
MLDWPTILSARNVLLLFYISTQFYNYLKALLLCRLLGLFESISTIITLLRTKHSLECKDLTTLHSTVCAVYVFCYGDATGMHIITVTYVGSTVCVQ